MLLFKLIYVLALCVQVNLVLCYKIEATEVRAVVIDGEETDKTRCEIGCLT